MRWRSTWSPNRPPARSPPLLVELEQAALRLGYGVVRLDTSQHLNEALALYRSSGYREIGPYKHNPYAARWFEKSLSRGG